MDYKQISISITPCEDWMRDILAAQLGEIGFDSFEETENGLNAYIPVSDFDKEKVDDILAEYAGSFTFDVSEEFIQGRNWNEEWEKNYFRPLVIKDECVIRAPFHTEYPKAKYEIVIEPNMAFGTGNHETTSMMVEFILESNLENKTVLDMGCGTGILGILASKKGAKQVTAIDIDEWSFNGTTENAAFNHIQNITVKQGDADLLGNEKFDIIFANIHKNVLMNDMPAYVNVLNKEGILIISGFYTEDIAGLKTRAGELGLADHGYKTKNNWVAQRFSKQ